MKVAVIDYQAGNIRSVLFALQRLGIEATVSADAEIIRSADRVIFPGVGEAASAMEVLKQKQLDRLIPQLKQPVLGICLGMQLLCRHSEEGNTDALNIFPVNVKRFSPAQQELFQKVPHSGWNALDTIRGPLFEGLQPESSVYFVHSYYAEIGEHTVAEAHYNHAFSAALCRANFYAVQFHPEKSGKTGELLIENFLRL